MTQGHAHDDPRKAAVVAAATWWVVAMLVCLATFFLNLAEFAPLERVRLAEDHAYLKLHSMPASWEAGVRPVVFFDITQAAVDEWRGGGFAPCQEPGSAPSVRMPAQPRDAATSRALLADAIRLLRDQKAASIFVDVDLRDGGVGEQALREALVCKSLIPVLLPRYFNDVPPDCADAPSAKPITEMVSAFERDMPDENWVHPLVEDSGHGAIDAVCSSFRVRSQGGIKERQAAMVRAVAAGCKPGLTCTPAILASLRASRTDLRWYVPVGRARLMPNAGDQRDEPLFRRIDAGMLLQDGAFTWENAIKGAIDGAVVIIGATHSGAGDVYRTPLGPMPGALLQANIAIGLQQGIEHGVSEYAALALEIIIILVVALLLGLLQTRSVYRRLRERRVLGLLLHRSVVGGLSLAFAGGMMLGIVLIVAKLGWEFAGGWRFGVTSFILSALAGFMIEATTVLAEILGDGIAGWRTGAKRPAS